MSDDNDLYQSYIAGDPKAALMLVSRVMPPIFAYVMRLTRDPAETEDIIQETLLRLWRHAQNGPDTALKVRPWLYRVAGNLALDRLRYKRRRPHKSFDDAEDLAAPAWDVVAHLIAQDRSASLSAAIATLPERQQQAIILRHLEGLSNSQIAAIMEIGVEAVESLLARGKKKLHSLLVDASPKSTDHSNIAVGTERAFTRSP